MQELQTLSEDEGREGGRMADGIFVYGLQPGGHCVNITQLVACFFFASLSCTCSVTRLQKQPRMLRKIPQKPKRRFEISCFTGCTAKAADWLRWPHKAPLWRQMDAVHFPLHLASTWPYQENAGLRVFLLLLFLRCKL